ncbi:hypothetical protein DY138_05170 [Apilactobacillus timberlakei]|uniref:hypothetical protein n=1 Tax=Apilactobacillus timberlakei TaxID=2008380 RepID=UPI00112DE37D|nr:hypothetical protein [Apilactobacillus timberlakei]TPR18476.1 hypothetical protein DY138_05170 [Apilactobacillus timberlakei]TPR20323.1 hypothetical protein DY061_05080 [Apilactobacillus timberlakei]TPR22086.1 hypothetical protein DY083_05070 [Apilactobacillus timberlakei]
MAKKAFNEQVYQFVKRNSSKENGISLKSIVAFFAEHHSSDSVRGVLNAMVNNGLIVRIDRGIYSLPSKMYYTSNVNEELINSINQSLSKYELGTDEYFKLNKEEKEKYLELRDDLKSLLSKY